MLLPTATHRPATDLGFLRNASFLSLLLTLAIPRAAIGQCVTKPSSCTEFVAVGPGSKRMLVYCNHSLTVPNDTVTRALIVVHGAGGPARWEFRNLLATAFLTGTLETTVIVAPHFATNDGSACTDSLAVNELNWKEHASRRPITFLLSQLDVDTPSGFFGSCGPMAQGRNRQERGLAFAQYLTEFNRQGLHKVIVVEACGHDARCVFTSDDALAALFPKTPQ